MKTSSILFRSPREFPLSVRATFEHQFQIFTQQFTLLSTSHVNVCPTKTTILSLLLPHRTSFLLTFSPLPNLRGRASVHVSLPLSFSLRSHTRQRDRPVTDCHTYSAVCTEGVSGNEVHLTFYCTDMQENSWAKLRDSRVRGWTRVTEPSPRIFQHVCTVECQTKPIKRCLLEHKINSDSLSYFEGHSPKLRYHHATSYCVDGNVGPGEIAPREQRAAAEQHPMQITPNKRGRQPTLQQAGQPTDRPCLSFGSSGGGQKKTG